MGHDFHQVRKLFVFFYSLKKLKSFLLLSSRWQNSKNEILSYDISLLDDPSSTAPDTEISTSNLMGTQIRKVGTLAVQNSGSNLLQAASAMSTDDQWSSGFEVRFYLSE
jgi:hypothetical protein